MRSLDKHGYPKITPALRAKVFGRNALRVYSVPDDVVRKHVPRDRVAQEREEYRARARPDVRHPRAEDAAGVPEVEGVGRLSGAQNRDRAWARPVSTQC